MPWADTRTHLPERKHTMTSHSPWNNPFATLKPATWAAAAGLALATAVSTAQAQDMTGQSIYIGTIGNGNAFSYNQSVFSPPLTAAGFTWSVTSAQVPGLLDTVVVFNLGPSSLTVEYASGNAGALNDFNFALLLAPSSPVQFASITKTFDSFDNHGSGASAGQILGVNDAVLFDIASLNPVSLAGSYSASASYAFTFTNVSAVPEPSAALMAGAGLLALAWRRRGKAQAPA
jgi:PEP-CTERM motif